MIISVDAEKAFNKILPSFMIKKKKILQKVLIEGNYLNIVKGHIYILNGEKLKEFPLRSVTR